MTGVTREIVRLPTHPGLRGLVAGVVGFREQSAVPLERRQPAGTLLPLVLSFGDPFEIVEVAAGGGRRDVRVVRLRLHARAGLDPVRA